MRKRLQYNKGMNSNKKGILSFEVMMFIPRLLFLSIMVLIIIVMVESFVKDQVDTSQVEIEIMTQRLIYSPNAISYCDERCYPGIIDMRYLETQKEFDKRLDSAFNSTIQRVAFKLKLTQGDKVIERTYNERDYKRFYDLSRAYREQYVSMDKEIFVLVRENNENKPAKLWLRMVMEVG